MPRKNTSDKAKKDFMRLLKKLTLQSKTNKSLFSQKELEELTDALIFTYSQVAGSA